MVRQSVIDREQNSFGFELLYQNTISNKSVLFNDDDTTAQTILNHYSGLAGDAPLTQNRQPVFIKTSLQFLANNSIPEIFFSTVIADISAASFNESCDLSKIESDFKKGLKICIDEFDLSNCPKELIALSSFLKININSYNEEKLTSLLKQLNTDIYHGNIILKNIEKTEQFQQGVKLGFHYFQGTFLEKPSMVENKALPHNSQTSLTLMAELYDEKTTPAKLERILSSDVILTTRLLKLINSAAFGFPQKVESIKKSIMLVGLNNLRQWVSLIILSKQSHKSDELMRWNLTRAAFCKNLATTLEIVDPEKAFLTGLLSMIDAYLDWPLDKSLKALPISDDIKEALLYGKGGLGDVLSSVRQYESADWVNLEHQSLAESVWGEMYLEAISWADETLSILIKPD